MLFLDLTLPTLADNLALDEALLLDAEAGGPEVLRLWHWRHVAVVLGAGGKVAEDVAVNQCRADNISLARRSSGGGTVLLGPGCFLYSLVLAYTRAPGLNDVNASYRYILAQLAGALNDLAPGVVQAGISDLAIAGRKFSGNSQQRKRSHLLHHGTILFAFDLDKISRYLFQPARQPDYRDHREHTAFLMNLPVEAPALTQRLQAHWQAHEPMISWPGDRVRALSTEKFATEEWTWRR